MNLQLVGLFSLFLYLQCQGIYATIVENEGYCGFSEEVEDLCSSYCYKSVRGPLSYIIELKDQMKVTSKENEERVEEVKHLKKNLLNNEKNTNQIDNLLKAIDMLKESIQVQNQNIAKIMDFNTNIINNQKAQTENVKKIIAAQDDLKIEVKQLQIQLLTDKKQMKEKQNEKESQNQNDFSEILLKMNQTEKELIECKKSLPNFNCKRHSTGIHNINIPGINSFPVLCNGDIPDGGWLVIHKRYDGSENFNRNWNEYRNGFGSLDGEFFIGLEKLHQITKQESYELYIQFGYFNDTSGFASYENFRIQNGDNKYLLEPLANFKGTVYDGMWFNRNRKFTTFDQDNDQLGGINCANTYYGAWWYEDCVGPNLNGRYYKHSTKSYDAMSWDGNTSLKSVLMLIRPMSSD